ncbi:MAG: [Rikenellaceae bacterium]|nr:[FeFe] hydrogenase H-cluster maturation GTPase HydF [Rikenellaceae bacterium]
MTQTPSSQRLHIGFYGRCNSGKSSLINALTGQQVALVSNVAGTTTDPVNKPMELPDLGAVTLVDTPGLDDNTALGAERMRATRRVMDRTDIAVVLFTDSDDWSVELAVMEELRRREVAVVTVVAGCDQVEDTESIAARVEQTTKIIPVCTSALTGQGLEELRRRLAACRVEEPRLLTEGFCEAGDTVLLVMPQDKQAPKGRLIQPQVQTLRELLDRGCRAMCCTTEDMASALGALAEPPRLIITDSQVFDTVWKMKPEESRLTSFSVLMARYKGDIGEFVEGAKMIGALTEKSRVLIAEACTHAPQNEDIGRVKLPQMLRRKVGEDLTIDVVGGADFPDDLSSYDLIIHCGACMFNRRHVMSRVARAKAAEVPITNYGVAIAALTGILNKIEF